MEKKGRWGWMFVYTLDLYSLSHATPWEHLPPARLSAGHPAKGSLMIRTTFIEGCQVLGTERKKKMEELGIYTNDCTTL